MAVSRALPWLLVGSLIARSAAAEGGQGVDPAAADALFQKGREAAEKGEWSVACPKFAESQRLDPAAGTLLNLGDCEDHLGRLASAYEHYKTALEMLPAGDDRIALTKQRIATVEKVVPHLTLVAPPDFPADARVMRDDVQLGSASFGLALPVNPGQHTIVVTVPGHADKRTSVSLRSSEAETVTLRLGDALPSAPPPRPSTHAGDVAAGPDGGAARTAGFVVGAVGLAGVGVGAVTGLLVLGKKSIVDDPSHCDPTTHVCDATGLAAASSGKTLSTVSTVAFVAGGALLVTGAVLVLTGGGGGGGGNASAWWGPRSGVAGGVPSATLLGPEMYGGGGAGLRVIHAF
jgi:hypothetical protein